MVDGEVLAVALILQSTQTLAAVGYTEIEAFERLGNDIDTADLDAAAQWFAELRAQL
nr:hypothetical protein [Rhodococcus sp. (in: high G+C Gram-positive bacteria)]